MTMNINQVASQIIPLPKSHVRRTNSEIQMANDEMVAEWKEYEMYLRLLNGRLRRCEQMGCHPKTESALGNKIRTNAHPISVTSLPVDIDNGWLIGDMSADHSSEDSHLPDQMTTRYSRLHCPQVYRRYQSDFICSEIKSRSSPPFKLSNVQDREREYDDDIIFEMEM